MMSDEGKRKIDEKGMRKIVKNIGDWGVMKRERGGERGEKVGTRKI